MISPGLYANAVGRKMACFAFALRFSCIVRGFADCSLCAVPFVCRDAACFDGPTRPGRLSLFSSDGQSAGDAVAPVMGLRSMLIH